MEASEWFWVITCGVWVLVILGCKMTKVWGEEPDTDILLRKIKVATI